MGQELIQVKSTALVPVMHIDKEQEQIQVKLSTSVPVMHVDQFSEQVGLSTAVVRGWVANGYVPTVKVGRYNLINLAKLTQECIGVSK